jgi:uncharacterized protein involved in exopolysaccharide biosynthesis
MKHSMITGSDPRGAVVVRDPGPAVPMPAAYSTVDLGRPVHYLRYLLSKKGTVALFALTGALLGALVVWRQPYIYRAHAYLEVQGVNEDLLNTRELDPTAKRDDSSQTYVNTIAHLLQSEQLFNQVAAKLNETPADGSAAQWNPPVTGKEIGRSVRVITHDTDRILEVAAESTAAKRAAAIANGLVAAFIQQDLESR